MINKFKCKDEHSMPYKYDKINSTARASNIVYNYKYYSHSIKTVVWNSNLLGSSNSIFRKWFFCCNQILWLAVNSICRWKVESQLLFHNLFVRLALQSSSFVQNETAFAGYCERSKSGFSGRNFFLLFFLLKRETQRGKNFRYSIDR